MRRSAGDFFAGTSSSALAFPLSDSQFEPSIPPSRCPPTNSVPFYVRDAQQLHRDYPPGSRER